VREENLHITLAFLGEQSGRDAALICKGLEAAFKGVGGFGKIPLSTGKLALFPRPAAASVLALRIAAGHKAARALAEKAAQALGRFLLHWNQEKRAFTPHITLARRGRAPIRGPMDATIEASGTVEQAGIFRSDLHPSGPVYTALALFPLL
ncbi:MAG: RNA 2',3'-cyclic phosphodiesterase, partial [Spirochaetaceae bacterium]|nr:RNA 2',3'-cyclic phosphodiesterase [Spirochaetaceae bacterium]